jgi:acyl-CoA hydrolase
VQIVSDESLGRHLSSMSDEDPRVVVSGNFAVPTHVLGVLDASLERYRLFALNAQGSLPVRPGVVHETPFVGPAVRGLDTLEYLPTRLSLVPRLFDVLRPVDVVVVHTSMPRHGWVSLGIEVNILPAALERARARGGLVVAQLNPQMPYTRGDGELPVDAVDLAVEVDAALPVPRRRPVREVAAAIGAGVADLVEDGATIQVGIGEIPDAVLASLHGVRDLGVWSEAISDGILELEHAGALDTTRPIVTTFLFGTPELYSFVEDNPRIRMLRTETVNDPVIIASQPMMCSLNSAMQVDLADQANASFVDGRVYSGFGGQPDFVVGALHSPGGNAVIALPSWHDKSGTSTIVHRLAEPVTSFQHSAVVTEHGRAMLFGRGSAEQAKLLVEEAAHPDARPALRDALGG